jgi:phosphatidyl-myo-inositol dimannoside synthase
VLDLRGTGPGRSHPAEGALQVFVVSDVRCFEDSSSGLVMATHRQAGYETWRPHVEAFGALTVVVRVGPSPPSGPDRGLPVAGPEVRVLATPYYTGGKGLLRQAFPTLVRMLRHFHHRAVVMVRVPEPLGLLAALAAFSRGARVISTVVIDPIEAPTPGANALFSQLLQRVLLALARWVVWRSAATIFVSEAHLQRRLPARPGFPTLARLDVDLTPADFVAAPRRAPVSPPGRLQLATIASLTDLRKGVDVLLQSLAQLRHGDRIDAQLHVIGDGRVRPSLERLAASLQLEVGRDVHFHGHLQQRAAVLQLLDRCDLYLSASRAEGLPRAIVEAMARGLPCIASEVGAVAELLPATCRVPPNAALPLAEAVRRLAGDQGAYAALSAAGLARAQAIAAAAAPERFSAFLKGCHDAWCQ